jgi:hypothetical protein
MDHFGIESEAVLVDLVFLRQWETLAIANRGDLGNRAVLPSTARVRVACLVAVPAEGSRVLLTDPSARVSVAAFVRCPGPRCRARARMGRPGTEGRGTHG